MPHRLATAFLSVKPKASLAEFTKFMSERLPKAELSDQILERLFDKYAKDKWNLADRGYITGVHPLQLWLVEYLQDHPEAKRSEVLQASADERQETYAWLFKTSRKQAQDTRIRILMEAEAFQRIHQVLGAAWLPVRQPDAFLRDRDRQLRRPSRRAGRPDGHHRVRRHRAADATGRALHFATGTPYEAVLGFEPKPGERVLRRRSRPPSAAPFRMSSRTAPPAACAAPSQGRMVPC